MNRSINLLVPGAPKCGTTSLYYYLRQHPDIYLSPAKEPHFFDSDVKYQKGFQWYLNEYFPGLNNEKYLGEMTPAYLDHHDVVIGRIRKEISNEIKFIIMLRDPVKRAWSHYQHMVRSGKESETFEDALELEEDRIVQDKGWFTYFWEGLYGHHLSKWFEVFGREQFLVLRQENLQKEPQEVLNQIFDFLGIEPIAVDVTKKFNQNSVIKHKRLNAFVKNPPAWAKVIYRTTLKNFITSAKRKSISDLIIEYNLKPKNSKESINIQTAHSLRKRYLADIDLLEEITGIEFRQWKI